ncbi:hypothetical protein KDV87_07745 [Citrobacter sedlakii]
MFPSRRQARRELCHGLLKARQRFSLSRQLAFKADIFSGEFIFAIKG